MKILLLLASALWRLGYIIDSKIRLAPHSADADSDSQSHAVLIGVGSLLAGGAGKTPYTAFLAEQFTRRNFRVAIICKNTGDENLWYAKKGFSVFTTSFSKNRLAIYNSIKTEFDIILLDDGLEDRRLGAFWICLTWGERAEKISDLIPSGKCRSLWRDHYEIYCIKKCAMEGSPNKADIIFSTSVPKNFFGEELKANTKIIALAGIARPERFFNQLSKKYILAKKIALPDHYKNIQARIEVALQNGIPVVITEKDGIKLSESTLRNKKVYVCGLDTTPLWG